MHESSRNTRRQAWRKRAQEIRMLAQTMRTITARRELLAMADQWDRMNAYADRRTTAQALPETEPSTARPGTAPNPAHPAHLDTGKPHREM
jgi:hypothetical protein